MTLILTLALHRRLSEFLGDVSCVGVRVDVFVIIQNTFNLGYTVGVFLYACVFVCACVLQRRSSDICPVLAPLYVFLNCVLRMWFLALRLTRQEQSAPTLGDMIEKVLPGK